MNFELSKALEDISSVEDKIKFILSKMKDALSQEQQADMTAFWKLKDMCIECFKESKLPPYSRKQLWLSFTDLSDRARDLKNIAIEEEEFLWQQVMLAVDAVKKDEADRNSLLNAQKKVEFPSLNYFSTDIYFTCKRIDEELRVLNILATRISDLRREIVQSKIRYKKKNVALKELNKLGDKVFPRKKELIDRISGEFEAGVMQFLDTYFSQNAKKESVYNLLDEIKSLQSLSKIFFLNTSSFRKLREELSKCWNVIISEKQRWIQKKQADKQVKQGFLAKISAFKEEDGKDVLALKKRYLALKQEITASKLRLADVKDLCAKLEDSSVLRDANVDFNKDDVAIKKQKEVSTILSEIKDNFLSLPFEELRSKLDNLKHLIDKSTYQPIKKELMLYELANVEDHVFEKSLSDESDVEKLRSHCSYVKKVLDNYKKISGYDLDMALSISFNDMIENTTTRLKKWQDKVLQAE